MFVHWAVACVHLYISAGFGRGLDQQTKTMSVLLLKGRSRRIEFRCVERKPFTNKTLVILGCRLWLVQSYSTQSPSELTLKNQLKEWKCFPRVPGVRTHGGASLKWLASQKDGFPAPGRDFQLVNRNSTYFTASNLSRTQVCNCLEID